MSFDKISRKTIDFLKKRIQLCLKKIIYIYCVNI